MGERITKLLSNIFVAALTLSILFDTAHAQGGAMKWRTAGSVPGSCVTGTSVTPADSIVVASVPYVCVAGVYKALMYIDTAVTTSQLPSVVVRKDTANTYTTGAQDFSLATSLTVPVAAGAVPTANGSIAYDSTNGKYVFGETIGASTTATTAVAPRFFQFLGASTTVTATVTETVFSTSTGVWPANFFTVGKIALVYIEVQDVMGGTPVSRIYKLRIQKSGPTNVYLYTPGVTTPTASSTRSNGMLLFIRCLTTGTTGTVDVGLVGNGSTSAQIILNTIAQPVTIDTTAAQTVQLTITLGATTAGETSQMRFMALGELN